MTDMTAITAITTVTTTTGLVGAQRLDLGASGLLEVVAAKADSPSTVVVRAADGTPRLTLTISSGEILLDCVSGATRLRVAGALTVDADSMRLAATHDMALHCGGDLTLSAGGRIDAVAERVSLEATCGDASITANDDVRIEGERIRMNA